MQKFDIPLIVNVLIICMGQIAEGSKPGSAIVIAVMELQSFSSTSMVESHTDLLLAEVLAAVGGWVCKIGLFHLISLPDYVTFLIFSRGLPLVVRKFDRSLWKSGILNEANTTLLILYR